MTPLSPPVDVLIAGGGIVGLALAVALRHELGHGIAVEVCDAAAGEQRASMRASAIAAGPRRMLEAIDGWPAATAQPIREMVITDSRAEDPVRPALLTFAGEIAAGEPFAHMAFNDDILNALRRAAAAMDIPVLPVAVRAVETRRGAAEAILADGTRRRARLVVGADGSRSRLRACAGIATVGWSYGQAAIVATVAHTRDHGGRANEHFLPSGPFATLPLTERRSSIVWTEKRREADALVAGDGAAFLAAFEQRFGHELGALTLLDQPRALPLELRLARRFTAERLALVGDAAHVVHPIAGQGLNLGLADVATLVDGIVEPMRLGLDPADALDGYERARRFDTVAMAASTDALNRLFSNDAMPVRLMRDLGLGAVDRAGALKRFFVREAAATHGDTPRLMRPKAAPLPVGGRPRRGAELRRSTGPAP